VLKLQSRRSVLHMISTGTLGVLTLLAHSHGTPRVLPGYSQGTPRVLPAYSMALQGTLSAVHGYARGTTLGYSRALYGHSMGARWALHFHSHGCVRGTCSAGTQRKPSVPARCGDTRRVRQRRATLLNRVCAVGKGHWQGALHGHWQRGTGKENCKGTYHKGHCSGTRKAHS
jgi:hypothetical protein